MIVTSVDVVIKNIWKWILPLYIFIYLYIYLYRLVLYNIMCHRNPRVATMQTLSSFVTPEVLVMTTTGVPSEDNIGFGRLAIITSIKLINHYYTIIDARSLRCSYDTVTLRSLGCTGHTVRFTVPFFFKIWIILRMDYDLSQWVIFGCLFC